MDYNRGRKNESKLRNNKIIFKVSVKEKEILTQLAEEEGQTVSEFIRRKLIYERIKNIVR